MKLLLDHFAVAGVNLDAVERYVEDAVGLPAVAHGQHDFFGTHNALWGLGSDLYLEAIAINPEMPAPDVPRWFGLDRLTGAPKLSTWILACDDLDAAFDILGKDFGRPVELQRGNFRWRMAVPMDGCNAFDGMAPSLIQWIGNEHPAPLLKDDGLRFEKLVVCHPDAARLEQMLSPFLRDDRITFEKAPAQLMGEFCTQNGDRISL